MERLLGPLAIHTGYLAGRQHPTSPPSEGPREGRKLGPWVISYGQVYPWDNGGSAIHAGQSKGKAAEVKLRCCGKGLKGIPQPLSPMAPVAPSPVSSCRPSW